MIIIDNTTGKSRAEVRSALFVAASYAAARNPKIWLHVEKQGREIAVNTDDDPITLIPAWTTGTEQTSLRRCLPPPRNWVCNLMGLPG